MWRRAHSTLFRSASRYQSARSPGVTEAGVGASQWWRMASTTTSAGQAAAGGNPAKELTARPVWHWALAGAVTGGLVYFYRTRSAKEGNPGDQYPVKPPEEVQGASGAQPGRFALPEFALTSADGRPLSLGDFKGEFVVVAFQDKGEAKRRLDKLADILFNIDRKSNMQYTRAFYLGEPSVRDEIKPYNLPTQTHLRVKGGHGKDVNKVRGSAGDFAKAVGSSSAEFFLAGPDGDWLVAFDRTSDTADITDSIASIIIDYNRKHPTWHYPKATKERHA